MITCKIKYNGLVYNLHIDNGKKQKILTTAETLEEAEKKANMLKKKNIIHEVIIKRGQNEEI